MLFTSVSVTGLGMLGKACMTFNECQMPAFDINVKNVCSG